MSASSTVATWLFVPDALCAAAGFPSSLVLFPTGAWARVSRAGAIEEGTAWPAAPASAPLKDPPP